MDSKEYREYRERVDKEMKKNVMNIKGEFSDFDRIFCQQDDKKNSNALLLISTRKQLFKRLDLESQQISELNIYRENEYQQVEYYDEKLFCINGESLTMEVFFSSKKQMLFHKRIIRFANKELKLKEDFNLIIWKHQEAGMLYRCLMGPLVDGRYMNFDLRERYFDSKESTNITIERVAFVRLESSGQTSDSGEMICTIDEAKKSVICIHKEKDENDRSRYMYKMFEYNGFVGRKSEPIYLQYPEKIKRSNLKKVYCYHAFKSFPKKKQYQLQTIARDIKEKRGDEILIENLYTELLLCMERDSLIKMSILEHSALAEQGTLWSTTNINMKNGDFPVDIAINEDNGEIYCLCSQRIYVLENSGRKIKEEIINIYTNKKQQMALLADS